MTQTVVFFGDSITRGQVSASYIQSLRRRLPDTDYQFVNQGVNNDTTYNLLRRIHHVVNSTPDFITILIGTNDIIASLNDANTAFYMLNKGIPEQPTIVWSVNNIYQLVRNLKARTHARIGLISIPMLGEDLTSEENNRVREYNQALKVITAVEGVSYIPVFERLTTLLGGIKGLPFRTSAPLTAEFLARHLLFQEGFDSFAQRKGYHLLIDGVHLNRRAADIVACEIEAFLRSKPASDCSETE